jgi:hypothetical protein
VALAKKFSPRGAHCHQTDHKVRHALGQNNVQLTD